MKNSLLILFCLLSTLLCAQDMSLFSNLRHSSVDAQGNIHVLFNSMDESFQDFDLYYSTGGAWTGLAASSPAFGEYEVLVPYSWGQSLDYRLYTAMEYEGVSFSYMQGAFVPETTFPPVLDRLAAIGADPTGDSLMVYAPALDITDSYVGYNDTKLMRAMRNAAGAFPTMNSLTSYNVYMSMIIKPDAASDSVAYGMIYCFNIPGVISTGLYKIGTDETEMPVFTRLGNVQSQVSGGTLFLSCNWADLTADPQFGTWPNMSGSLMLTEATIKLDIDITTMQPNFSFGDIGCIAVTEFVRHHYQVSQNTLPTVQWLSYSPLTGEYSLSYSDAEMDCPLVARLQLDDTGMNFVDLTPSFMDVANGQYQYMGLIPAGNGYYFQFSDNGYDYVTLGEYVSNEDQVIPAPAAITLRAANPFRVGDGALALQISGLDKAPYQVTLYNLRGQAVGSISGATPKSSIENLSLLPGKDLGVNCSGVYLLSVRQGTRNTTQKILFTR